MNRRVAAGRRRVVTAVEIDILGLVFVDVVGDGGVAVLPGDPAAAPEGGGAIHARHQLCGNGLAGLVMAGELGQHLRAANPLLEHLRRSFHEIGFHADAADARPLLLAAEDVVHQVAEFVEESLARRRSPSGRDRSAVGAGKLQTRMASGSCLPRTPSSTGTISAWLYLPGRGCMSR